MKEGDVSFEHTVQGPWLTRKDRARERQGAFLLMGFVLFTVGTPIAGNLLSMGTVSWHTPLIVLPWIFNLWLFGWRKMVAGAVLLRHLPQGSDDPSGEELGQGYLWSDLSPTPKDNVVFAVELVDGRPRPKAWHAPHPNGREPLPSYVAEAWAYAVSGGDTWSLVRLGCSAHLDRSQPPTSHARMALMARWANAETKSPWVRVAPDRWFEALARLFPGRLAL